MRAALKLKAELARRQDREKELLNFVSNRGDRRPGSCIDDLTGLFVAEVAEAYLTGTPARSDAEPLSVITLAVDRLDACRAARGDKAANAILASVAAAIRSTSAAVGVVAASYRNGLFVIVAPGYDATAGRKFAESLRAAVAHLALTNVEAISARSRHRVAGGRDRPRRAGQRPGPDADPGDPFRSGLLRRRRRQSHRD